jgi:hypothetical protein
MLSALKLQSIEDRMINECGTVDGIIIGRGTEVFVEELQYCDLSTTDATSPDLELNPVRRVWKPAVVF